jgi:hypothetical protein
MRVFNARSYSLDRAPSDAEFRFARCTIVDTMSRLQATTPSARVLISHTSTEGPMITHVRGTIVANAISNLQHVGVYEDYLRIVPESQVRALLESLPVSWIPTDQVLAHYLAVDKLGLSRAHFEEIGQRNAQRITETFLGLILKQVRTLGVDTLKQAVLKLGSVHDRMWRGGGCEVLEHGPKDLVFEFHGCPFAQSRSFRTGYETYGQALANIFCKVAYVRPIRSNFKDGNALALSMNWV